MSVWCTTSVLDAKSFVHSGFDPRKKADTRTIELAVVPEYVYNEANDEGRILPYVRLSLFQDDVLLTEKQAQDLINELQHFVNQGKWRGKPRKEQP